MYMYYKAKWYTDKLAYLKVHSLGPFVYLYSTSYFLPPAEVTNSLNFVLIISLLKIFSIYSSYSLIYCNLLFFFPVFPLECILRFIKTDVIEFFTEIEKKKNSPKIRMAPRRTPKSQSNLEKGKQSQRHHAPWFQTILQGYSNKTVWY